MDNSTEETAEAPTETNNEEKVIFEQYNLEIPTTYDELSNRRKKKGIKTALMEGHIPLFHKKLSELNMSLLLTASIMDDMIRHNIEEEHKKTVL
ncbi:MAG: hypothetical protein ACERKN_10495 [Velocimicrobium sp.]